MNLNLELIKEFVYELPETQASFFERIYSEGLEKYSNRLKQYGFYDFESVLDAGSGFGQWSLALSQMNKQVSGIEYSKDRVCVANKIKDSIGVDNLSFVSGSIEELPFEDSSFDAVFCYGVIFLTDWKKSLRELCRVLRTNGRLYLNANGLGWYYNLIINEHNKGGDYNPRELGINTFVNTDRYKRRDEIMVGIDVLISPEELEAELIKNGCQVLFRDAEGKINANVDTKSFFAGEYFGEIGVYEIIAKKVVS